MAKCKKNRIPTSKKLLGFSIGLTIAVVAFTFFAVIMQYEYQDQLTPVVYSVFGQLTAVAAGYLKKSRIENSKDGITYETAIQGLPKDSDTNC